MARHRLQTFSVFWKRFLVAKTWRQNVVAAYSLNHWICFICHCSSLCHFVIKIRGFYVNEVNVVISGHSLCCTLRGYKKSTVNTPLFQKYIWGHIGLDTYSPWVTWVGGGFASTQIDTCRTSRGKHRETHQNWSRLITNSETTSSSPRGWLALLTPRVITSNSNFFLWCGRCWCGLVCIATSGVGTLHLIPRKSIIFPQTSNISHKIFVFVLCLYYFWFFQYLMLPHLLVHLPHRRWLQSSRQTQLKCKPEAFWDTSAKPKKSMSRRYKKCVRVSVVMWPVANMNVLAPVINGCYDFFTHFTCDFFTISAYLDLQPRLEKVIETAQVL